MKGNLRHRIIWAVLYWPVALYCRLFMGYIRRAVRDIEGPYILLSNHVTDWDPIFVGVSMKKQMYFVASDHVMRKGFVSSLLRWALAPIGRTKGSTDGAATLNILRAVRKGHNICIFAEGDRTWNGLTRPLHPSTARLIKASKCTLVTFRLTGGYFKSPRWSSVIRRGPMSGSVVGVYSADDIKGMSNDEVADLIARDLSEDAWARQALERTRFRSPRRAEGLENALYICPKCGGIDTMKGVGSRFACSKCGLSVTMDELGFFEDTELQTVPQWEALQQMAIGELAAKGGTFYRDGGQTLCEVADGEETVVAQGDMVMDGERFAVGDVSFELGSIIDWSMIRMDNLVFTADGRHYRVRMAGGGCIKKYHDMLDFLKGE